MDYPVGYLEWNCHYGQMCLVRYVIWAVKTVAIVFNYDFGMDLRLPYFVTTCSHGHHSRDNEWSCILGPG